MIGWAEMKSGIRYYENASCKISTCTAIPERMRAKTRELTHVDVPENLRKQGMATQLLTNVCDEADAHGITLLIFPEPFGTGPKMSKDALMKWYSAKFGFTAIQAKPVMMARAPFGSPRVFKPTLIASLINKVIK